MPFQKDAQINQIKKHLIYLQTYINTSNALGQTDVNSAAEDFYCGLLNIVLGGYHLKNLNLLQMNFPALDLGDDENRLCVQVTSTNDGKKIETTLQKFFANGLQRRFDRLIVLIIGEKKKYQRDFSVEEGFDFDPERDIWDTNRLMQKISVLETLQLDAVVQYLQASMNLPAPSTPLQLPLHTSLGVDGFVGRQEELRALEKAIAEHDKPIILSGLGGMGKTELATHFGRNYRDGKVYLASFQKSFRESVTQSIAKGIPGLLEKKLPEDEVYKTVMNRLGQCVKDDILILDNVDRDTGSFADLLDDAYDALCGLDMRLIFTTRYDVDRAIEIKQLSNSELYQIFQKHKVTISDQEMDALIQAVDGHTLTIDLMARTMKDGWRKVTAEMLLQALQEKNLAAQNYRAVSTDYNRSAKQERIYDHLRTVFNVAGVPDAAKSVLCYATLLPQDGMDAETFGMALQEEEQQTLDDLIDHGFLAVKDDILTIHPVVRLVCREELKPSDEKCEGFLASIWDQYDQNQYNKNKYRQLAEFYSMASDVLEDQIGNCALAAGIIWYQLGDSNNVLKYNLLAVSRKERTFADGHPELVSAYTNLGATYSFLGDDRKSLEFHLKALETRLKNSSAEDAILATLYCSVGQAYTDIGDSGVAIGYLLQSLKIWKKIRSEDHLDLATTYNNLGFACSSQGEYKLALFYFEKALESQKVLPPNHPKNASCYDNIGRVYYALSDYKKALTYRQKALDIREDTLPENHPSIAASYNNIGFTFSTMGEHEVALDYHKIALTIGEHSLPFWHPSLAISRCNIAVSLWKTGHLAEAIDYLQKELNLAMVHLSENHRYCQELSEVLDQLTQLL